MPAQPTSNLVGSPFTGPQSRNQTVQGNYTPEQPQSGTQSQPILTRPRTDPNSGIPSWVQNLGPTVSIDDSIKIQQLYRERNDLRQQVTENPVGDLGTMIGEVITAGVTGEADQPPLGEERHQQRFRINEINQQLQQMFDRNNILASPLADDSAPQSSQLNTQRTSDNGNNGDFSVHVSDSTPNGLGGAPAQKPVPFDWKSGWQNRFQDSLSPLDFQAVGGPAGPGGPADPGGIDFRSVRWVYLSEDSYSKPGKWNARSFACGIQATRSPSGAKVNFPGASRLVSDAFFTFLTIPDQDLWVNLHPAEPDRIISATLGRTDIGRIMLEADFQLKRDAGKLMKTEPFASAERSLVDSVVRRHRAGVNSSLQWGSTGRVEISSATSRVFARESSTGVFIEGVILDVVFEQKALHVAVGDSQKPLEISPGEWAEFVRLTQKWIRPQLIRWVNQAPEYESLRQIFSARVLSDWYKRKPGMNGALAPLIDRAQLDGLTSTEPWTPRQFWERFRQDYERGATRGYGGVSLQRMPVFEPMPGGPRPGAVLLAEALASPAGSWRRGVYRTGRIFAAIERPSRALIAFRWAIALVLLAVLALMALRKRSNLQTTSNAIRRSAGE